MLGKLVGAFAGERLSRNVRGVNRPAGALIGAGAVAAARRLGVLGIVAAAVGGYALKRHYEKRDARLGEGGSPLKIGQ